MECRLCRHNCNTQAHTAIAAELEHLLLHGLMFICVWDLPLHQPTMEKKFATEYKTMHRIVVYCINLIRQRDSVNERGKNKYKRATPLNVRITFIAFCSEFNNQQTNSKSAKRWRENKKRKYRQFKQFTNVVTSHRNHFEIICGKPQIIARHAQPNANTQLAHRANAP